MRNNKKSKIKKTVASVLIALSISMSLSSSISLAQQFDENKSAIAYCSQPLKVKIGPIYDYRYFVYASKTGSSDLSIKIEKGFANSLENLYPGSKAQLSGKQITVKDSTSFILHDLGGGELALSGDAQFALSEKCDELVATMTAINGYAKQKLIEDEGLTTAQVSFIKTLMAVAETISIQDIIGYEPAPRLPVPVDPKAYAFDTSAIVTYLEGNGYRGSNFVSSFVKFLHDEEIKFPETKDMPLSQKVDSLISEYDNIWLKEISGQITFGQRVLLQKYLNEHGLYLDKYEKKELLEILVNEKIYKHSSDSAKWLSLAEYLSKSDEGLDVEYKIVNNFIDPKYDTYFIFDFKEMPQLQIFKKSNGLLLNEIPIVPVKIDENVVAAIAMPPTNPDIRILQVDLSKAESLSEIPMSLVHEVSHEVTFTLDSFVKINVGLDKDSAILAYEGLSTYDKYRFATEQINSGLSNFKINLLADKYYRLTSKDLVNRNYADGASIYEFIRIKFGQANIDKIKMGGESLEKIIDIKGLDSVFRTQFLFSLTDELNAQLDDLLKIANKAEQIKDTIMTNVENPDISKINGYLDELHTLSTDIKNRVSTETATYFSLSDYERSILSENSHLSEYIEQEILQTEYYRDAPKERVEYFMKFLKEEKEYRIDLLNRFSNRAVGLAKIYGKIIENKVPPGLFFALEDAANNFMEKIEKIKTLNNDLSTEKSLVSLNNAENSNVNSKISEEFTKPIEVAKKSVDGKLAIATGAAIAFALGPKFVEYGEENSNPFLINLGTSIEYSGLSLLVASAGATVAKAAKIALPQILKGLVLTTKGFLSGTVIGLLVVALVEMVWCVINPFGALCFTYIQPTLSLSKTKGFTGEKISYEISGFDVKNGIGNQEGKKYILTYQGSLGLQLGTGCTVSSDKCKGEFTAPSTSSDAIKIFAQDIDNTYKSASVTFEKLKSQLTVGATVATDKSYLCVFNKEWKGETELEMACAKI